MKKYLLLFLLLFLTFNVFGQLNRPDWIANIAKPQSNVVVAFDPTQISGLAYRWTFTSLTTNAAVSSWVDSVQSASLAQSTAANRPTNTTDGVRFGTFSSNPQYLNLASAVSVTNYSIWFVLKPELVDNTWASIIANNSGDGGFGLGWTTGNFPNCEQDGGLHKDFSDNLPTNKFTSIVWTMASNFSMTGYTNNGATTVSGSTFNKNYQEIYWISAPDGSYDFQGWIKEIAIWTNTAINLTQASNLFWYSTNKYGP